MMTCMSHWLHWRKLMAKDRYRVWVEDVEVAYDVTLKEARITASEFACAYYTGIDIEKLEKEIE